MTIADYSFRFEGVGQVRGPNYDAIEGTVMLGTDGRDFATLKPQKRFYASGGNPMTEAGIHVTPLRDLFVALGDDLGDGKWSMRVQYKPLIRYIWIGALLMAIGGFVSIADRRYRARAAARDAVNAGGTAGEAAS